MRAMSDQTEAVAREIERLRRRHHYLLAETHESLEAPCRWELVGHALLWRVFLDDVLEPDLDVEILAEVIVVRGTLDLGERPARHALLPIPAPFASQQPTLRFLSGVLEIRIEMQS